MQVPPAKPEDLRDYIGKPVPGTDDLPPVALVMAPGGFLYPPDYSALVDAVQRRTARQLQLWTFIRAVDWPSLAVQGPSLLGKPGDSFVDLDGAVAALSELGFPAAKEPCGDGEDDDPGRYTNVAIAGHSAGGVWAIDIAWRRTAQLITLAAGITPNKAGRSGYLSQWPTPVLSIFGELDGQYRPTLAALRVAEAAEIAASFGPEYLAAQKPVLLLEGHNHGQFAQGKVTASRGDIASDISQEQATADAVEAIAAFLTVRHAARDSDLGDAVSAARGLLLRECRAAAERVAPFLAELGRAADVVAAFSTTPEEAAAASSQAVLPGGVQTFCSGAEAVLECESAVSHVMHPGEMRAARALALAAQLRILEEAGVPADDVIVSVRVFSDEKAYRLARPSLQLLPGGKLQSIAHCLPYRSPATRQNQGFTYNPLARELWVALWTPEAIALQLEVAGGGHRGGDGRAGDGLAVAGSGGSGEKEGFSAQRHNAECLARAEQLVIKAARARYEARGCKLQLQPDKYLPASEPVASFYSAPLIWSYAEAATSHNDVGTSGLASSGTPNPPPATSAAPPPQPHAVQVSSPVLVRDGVWNAKLLTPALCMEWLMVGALQQPPPGARPQKQ